jgi:hypothetical protein
MNDVIGGQIQIHASAKSLLLRVRPASCARSRLPAPNAGPNSDADIARGRDG